MTKRVCSTADCPNLTDQAGRCPTCSAKTDRARGTAKEDLLQGISVWFDGHVYFQIKDVKKHLAANDFKHFTSNKITLTLQEFKAEKIFWRIGGFWRGDHHTVTVARFDLGYGDQ